MDMVKVDPKLFVICRLCLVETGMYQVTPTVAEEIEYCFSITVHQYDGLPQLICDKCQKILNEYTTLKKTFVGRQNALKTQLQIRKEVEETLTKPPQQQHVNSIEQVEEEAVLEKPLKARRRKSRIISSSSSVTSERTTSTRCSSLLAERSLPQKRKTSREPWEDYFIKRLGCKICNKNVKSTSNIINHQKKHANIIKEHKHILDRPCEVKLIKLDTQPNLTGNQNTVVLRHDRIVGRQSKNAFVFYTPMANSRKTNNNEEELDIRDEVQAQSEAENEANGQSDRENSDYEIKGKSSKRPRILSTDTVVLKDDDKNSAIPERKKTVMQNDAEIECINLDDSSNDSTQNSDELAKDTALSVQRKDLEAIKNIIKVCHNKYVERKNKMSEWNVQPTANKDPHLKTKLLSMGRKIIKHEGLSCTGLLRFMEHKNLAVKWIPNLGRNKTSKEGNYVRIMPRLKGRNELIADNSGWKNRISEKKTPSSPGNSKKAPVMREASPENIEVRSQSPKEVTVTANDSSDVTINTKATVNGEISTPTFVAAVERRSLPMLLIPESVMKTEDNKILLNANPVANPKQLPKKGVTPDSKLFIQASIQSIAAQNGTSCNENNQETVCIDLVDAPDEPEEMCLPIITHTTSLVASSCNDDEDKDANVETVSNTEKPAPFRLKVKPVSEINSAINCKSVLSENNNQPCQIENVWTFYSDKIEITQVPKGATGYAPRPAGTSGQGVSEIPLGESDVRDENRLQGINQVYVLMDTVELPNTKTDSPFSYIKDLLKIHNMLLLDPTDLLTNEFTCLIKFRLQIQRPINNQSPLTLCLSVHCKDNIFYLGVKDPNSSTNLDLNKLPANWQWEILKIYTTREDVIAKMKQNAQKHGPDMYSYTLSFLAILKSITFTCVV